MATLGCQCSKSLKAAVVREARKMGTSESHLIRYGMAMFLHKMGALKAPPNPLMLAPSGRKRTPVKFAKKLRKVEMLVCGRCGSRFPERYHEDLGMEHDMCPGCGLIIRIAKEA